MKKLIIFAVWASIFIGVQFFVNCSNPLETTRSNNHDPINPVYEVDTIYSTDTILVIDSTGYVDTVFVFDTTFFSDTIFVFDTLVLVDTLVIYEPDSSGTRTVCSRIGSNQHEIVWMFRNEAGPHLLEFTALVEKEHPAQVFGVFVDGEEIEWKPVNSPDMTTEIYLEQNATIMILPKKPPAFGHSVDICLTMSPL